MAKLFGGDHACLEQALLEALELARKPDPLDAGLIKSITRARAKPTLVEDVGDMGVGVLLEERVYLLAHLGVGRSHLLRRERTGQGQGGAGAAAKTDRNRNLTLLRQRDVLHEEREHSLSLALRCVGALPDCGKIGGEIHDPLALLVIDREPFGGALSCDVLSCRGEGTQLGVPVGLERIGDEPVLGIHLQVAESGVIGFVLRPLDLPLAEAVGLVETGSNLFLNGEASSAAIGVTVSTSSCPTEASSWVPRMLWQWGSP